MSSDEDEAGKQALAQCNQREADQVQDEAGNKGRHNATSRKDKKLYDAAPALCRSQCKTAHRLSSADPYTL